MSYRILKTNVLAGVLILSVLGVACDGPTQPGNAVPTPTPTPSPTPVLEVNYTVSGVISEMVDGAPVPVAGADVEEFSTGQSALTDSNGFYSLPGIKTRHTYIYASKQGYGGFSRELNGSADMRLDIRLERFVTYTLSGMAYEVTPAGRVPIPGIALYCDGCGSAFGHTFATTDKDGLYSFGWVPPGVTDVMVDGKEGYTYVGPISSRSTNWTIVSIATPGDTRFDFEFVRR